MGILTRPHVYIATAALGYRDTNNNSYVGYTTFNPVDLNFVSPIEIVVRVLFVMCPLFHDV